jgi:hypothetical protein
MVPTGSLCGVSRPVPIFNFQISSPHGQPKFGLKRQWFGFRSAILAMFAALFLSASNSSAQTALVDTGTPTAAVSSINAAGSSSCLPQPSCGQSFQWWAGQFTLSHAATITSVQVAMDTFISGPFAVKIYSDTKGMPATAIFAQTYAVTATGIDGWSSFVFSSPNPSLAAGTYWLAFEPVAVTSGTAFSANIDGHAPNPLAHYAVWNEFSLINQYGNGYRVASGVGLGMRVYGTSYPDLVFGAVGRDNMTGETFGIPFGADNVAGGVGQASIYLGAGEIPGAFSLIRGSLFPNSLSTGSWSGASSCTPAAWSCTDGAGGARSIVFRTYTNVGATSLTFQSNAQLHGSISGSGGTGGAFGRVYVFDPTLFSNTLSAQSDVATFLTKSVPFDQGLETLFSNGAVLAKVSQALTTQNVALSAPLNTPQITLGAGQSITLMFDVSTITPSGSVVDFFSTLDPATNLFTDQSGNPVTQLLGVGPAVPLPGAAANLSVSPATATYAAGTSQTVTATVTDSSSAAVAGVVVTFTIASGPNTQAAVPALTDANGHATFTYTDVGGAGTDAIQVATSGVNSSSAQITWTSPGPLDHITISPSNSAVAVGGTQAYTAQGFDAFNTSIGDVTAATSFSISPDGSCAGASCTASTAGLHTVTASDNGKTAQASLQVGGVVDSTPPQITCAAPDTLWHSSDVSIACTASDSGSGLANSADASFSLSTNVAANTETSAAQTGTHVVCDKAGNCATAGPIGPIKVDKKGPTVTVNTPVSNAAYLLNQTVNANYICTDGGSGVASCTGSVANGVALDTTSVGTKTLTINATDAVGNKTQTSVTYTVGYAAAGICDGDAGHQILQPINADGTSVWNQGRTVPVKFRVCNASGASVGTAGVVSNFTLVQITKGTVTNVDETVTSTSADNAFRWDASGQQWIFNVSTANMPGGQTYTFLIQLNDGSKIYFSFGLK